MRSGSFLVESTVAKEWKNIVFNSNQETLQTSKSCQRGACVDCHNRETCLAKSIQRLEEIKADKARAIADLQRGVTNAQNQNRVEHFGSLDLNTTLPIQHPFFTETKDRRVRSALPATQPRSLTFERPSIRLNNLSPLANFQLISECCGDSICKSEVDRSRAVNGMTPASFSEPAPTGRSN